MPRVLMAHTSCACTWRQHAHTPAVHAGARLNRGATEKAAHLGGSIAVRERAQVYLPHMPEVPLRAHSWQCRIVGVHARRTARTVHARPRHNPRWPHLPAPSPPAGRTTHRRCCCCVRLHRARRRRSGLDEALPHLCCVAPLSLACGSMSACVSSSSNAASAASSCPAACAMRSSGSCEPCGTPDASHCVQAAPAARSLTSSSSSCCAPSSLRSTAASCCWLRRVFALRSPAMSVRRGEQCSTVAVQWRWCRSCPSAAALPCCARASVRGGSVRVPHPTRAGRRDRVWGQHPHEKHGGRAVGPAGRQTAVHGKCAWTSKWGQSMTTQEGGPGDRRARVAHISGDARLCERGGVSTLDANVMVTQQRAQPRRTQCRKENQSCPRRAPRVQLPHPSVIPRRQDPAASRPCSRAFLSAEERTDPLHLYTGGRGVDCSAGSPSLLCHEARGGTRVPQLHSPADAGGSNAAPKTGGCVGCCHDGLTRTTIEEELPLPCASSAPSLSSCLKACASAAQWPCGDAAPCAPSPPLWCLRPGRQAGRPQQHACTHAPAAPP